MTTLGGKDFTQLIEVVRENLPPKKVALVEEAYRFAEEAHRGQVRLSGDPYLEHPLNTALILAELQMDASSLAAALLHDIPEDCGIPISDIEKKFGPEISKLVNGVTKMNKAPWQASKAAPTDAQAENLRKMLVAMAEDLRVVFIKLADRLHNMRTLDALPPEKQRWIAEETQEIYAPLASRLGIWELKWQLEDLSFRYLEPENYHRIAKLIASRRAQRESFISKVTGIVEKEFGKAELKAEISGRPKHIYSIYQKVERYTVLGKRFDDIYDLLALRVLVSTIPDCYAAVGIIHSLWRPLHEAFDDYIANPKPNGYQSLHTAVMTFGTTPLEVQIRTKEIHHVDEYGVAAHWRYKEGEKTDIKFEEKVAWLRQLVEWHRELSGAREFLESVKTDIFIDQVFVYTPKGEIKDLPKGATPLDFAYRVHTEVGHRCIGAKVNGRLVPLTYKLKNGDMIEIMSTKGAKGPSRDWLNPHLGYIKTSHAADKMRQWFKRQKRAENIEQGRQVLEKELKRLGVQVDRQDLASQFDYNKLDDFLAAIGHGAVTIHQIVMKLVAQQKPSEEEPELTPVKSGPVAVRVLGVGDLVTHLAQCCRPVPGDKIIGYITRSKGVTVHRQDCHNIKHEKEKERFVDVDWGETDAVYPVNIQVEAWDRVGLMRDITTLVAEEKINIAAVSTVKNDDHTVTEYFTLQTKDLAQLSQIMARIEGTRGVTSVFRIGDMAPVKTKS